MVHDFGHHRHMACRGSGDVCGVGMGKRRVWQKMDQQGSKSILPFVDKNGEALAIQPTPYADLSPELKLETRDYIKKILKLIQHRTHEQQKFVKKTILQGIQEVIRNANKLISVSAKEVTTEQVIAIQNMIRNKVADQINILEAQNTSLKDDLTGLYNKKFFMEQLYALVKRISNESEKAKTPPLSVIMIDLTGFKYVNDTHGHLIGDQFLRHIALSLKNNLRPQDIICRYGGDEFCIIFQAGAQEAESAIKRIAEKFNNTPFLFAASEEDENSESEVFQLPIRFDAGIVDTDFFKNNSNIIDPDEMISFADTAAYIAKMENKMNEQDCISIRVFEDGDVKKKESVKSEYDQMFPSNRGNTTQLESRFRQEEEKETAIA